MEIDAAREQYVRWEDRRRAACACCGRLVVALFLVKDLCLGCAIALVRRPRPVGGGADMAALDRALAVKEKKGDEKGPHAHGDVPVPAQRKEQPPLRLLP